MRSIALFLLMACWQIAPAADVRLETPLITKVLCEKRLDGKDYEFSAVVTVPDDAPGDIGVGAFVTEGHRGWFQRTAQKPLRPGLNDVRFTMTGLDVLKSEPFVEDWNPLQAMYMRCGGLFFWTSSGKRVRLKVDRLAARPITPDQPRAYRLLDAAWGPSAETGKRWSLSVRPDPFPTNPYDAAQFTIDAQIILPDGSAQMIPGFYQEPMQAADRGDAEIVTPAGLGSFSVRFRPRLPGVHRITLRAQWGKNRSASATLPPLDVAGAPWDDYVRVDAQDPRFFSRAGAFFWPVGPNLRSVNDQRGHEQLRTAITPDRGTFSYAEYLDRLAIGQCSAIEVWMCAWNLALEWNRQWPGFHGVGRYNQGNAWRLDRLLDMAYARGIRLNLVTHNHGQASDYVDHEWENSPYNRANGGQLNNAIEFFTSEYALTGQENLRRYVVARYADHPGILGWKLWTEITLTAAGGQPDILKRWHEHATERWHALDIYDHPTGSHWHAGYHMVQPEVAGLPGLDYLCINGYNNGERTFLDLAHNCLFDPKPERRLELYKKPVIVSEYGCSYDGGPDARMRADHASGAWSAMVNGHAGAPMIWWFEWMDQGDHYGEYRAISRYLRGEDLRGADAKTIALPTSSAQLQSRAWVRPGRMLGYVLDRNWGRTGRASRPFAGITLNLGNVKPGSMAVEWWDADAGVVTGNTSIEHASGNLTLDVPAFSRHCAFKMSRK